MRLLPLLMAAALALAGCSGFRDTSGETGASLSDFGSSIRGGIGQNTDTFGTNRRVDVYGGSTAPSLPSIATPGLGK